MVVNPVLRGSQPSTAAVFREHHRTRWPRESLADPPIGELRYVPGGTPARRTRARGLRLLWARFADDRDLVRPKLMLLAGLIILTALLERVSP
jgi:hypothetical protein